MRAILTYHSIDPSGSPVSVDEEAFRAHVRWLASGAVRVVALADLPGLPAEASAAALTFDDAFANFASAAWPVLRAHGLPVTLFVVSGQAGGTNAWQGQEAAGIPTLPLLDWDALARLADEGVTLGAHSRTHPDLRRLDDARLADELDGSAAAIAERTGRRPEAFAYPFGHADERVVRATATRFRLAVTTELRALRGTDSAHRLPRLDAYYLRGAGQLERWGKPAFRRRLALRAVARRVRATMGGSAP